MASHFSTIGLPVKSQKEFQGLARRVADDTASFDCPEGRYLRWSSPSGAEVWLQVDLDDNLVGMSPHFSGESLVRVGLTARVNRPGGSALDGAFHGWAAPADDNPESGCYPFVFDAPEFQLHHNLQVPGTAEVQVAAFAHEVSLFASPEAHAASQTGEVRFASQSFIPSGIFSPAGERTEPPDAHAIFTGHILKTASRKNELTGNRFCWALVETLGGVFDVVIDPELIKAAPKVGGVLSGAFWLSGRLLGVGRAVHQRDPGK
jgi:hypothetical protein